VNNAKIVAIDGPAGSGKSTVARRVANELGFLYLDTGAIYRSVALAAIRRRVDFQDGNKLGTLARQLRIRFVAADPMPRVVLDDEDVSTAIRSAQVASAASAISAHVEVRDALLEQQRLLAHSDEHRGTVLEGRDIGTVVFPQAEHKFFLHASVEERAQRRCLELRARGEDNDIGQVAADIRERDQRDMQRAHAPLRQADDAIEIDSTKLSIDQVVQRIVAVVQGTSAPPLH
jgi:cytidylate kinase